MSHRSDGLTYHYHYHYHYHGSDGLTLDGGLLVETLGQVAQGDARGAADDRLVHLSDSLDLKLVQVCHQVVQLWNKDQGQCSVKGSSYLTLFLSSLATAPSLLRIRAIRTEFSNTFAVLEKH